jgi:hypothetical protein
LISANGNRMVYLNQGVTGNFVISELQGGGWIQIGGAITATNWPGVNRSIRPSLSFSADGTIVAFGANSLSGGSGTVSIYQYNSSKTIAQLSNGNLSTYGPSGWDRIGWIQGQSNLGTTVSLSANGKTIAVSGDDFIQVYVYKLVKLFMDPDLDSV